MRTNKYISFSIKSIVHEIHSYLVLWKTDLQLRVSVVGFSFHCNFVGHWDEIALPNQFHFWLIIKYILHHYSLSFYYYKATSWSIASKLTA